MIDWTELDIRIEPDGAIVSDEIIFTHVAPATRKVTHFAVSRLEAHLRAHPVEMARVAMNYDFARDAIVNRGIEEHRLKRITRRIIKTNPVIFAYDPLDDTHLLIDGSHRYVKAAMLGMDHIIGYIVEPDLWQQYVVRFPEKLDDISRRDIENQWAKPIDSRIR